MRSMMSLIVLLSILIVSNPAAAQMTPEERKARAMVEVLKEQKDKEAARQLERDKDALRAQLLNSEKSAPVSGTWVTISTLGVVAVLYWIFYRPDVNGWQIPFFGKSEQNPFAKWEKERKDRVDSALGNLSLAEVGKLSVTDICKRTGATAKDVEYGLREREWIAADYDGREAKARFRKISERT